jgi:hypothetical protein
MTTKLNGLGRNPADNAKALSDTTRGFCTVARKLYDTDRKLYDTDKKLYDTDRKLCDTARKPIFSELREIGGRRSYCTMSLCEKIR